MTLTGATLTGAAAGNYSLTSVNTTTANITALGIVTGNFTVANKVYDGNTSATVLSRTLTGVLAGDVGNVSLIGGTATFANANAGTGKIVTLTGATLTGAASGNYSLTSVNTTTANITALGITGNFTAANKVYDGTTSATVQTRTLTGVIGADAVSLIGGTATFATANAGLGKTVTLTGATLTGAASGNYSLASVNTTTADIAKATVTITGNGLNGSGYFGTYDGAAHAATATVRGVGGVVLGQVTSSTTHTNVGVYSDTVTYTDATGNYNNASRTVKSYITKAAVTLTGGGLNGSGYYGAYDGAAHAATATVRGVGGVVLGQVTSSTTHTNAGVYSDTVTYTDGTGNYKNASKVVKSYVTEGER